MEKKELQGEWGTLFFKLGAKPDSKQKKNLDQGLLISIGFLNFNEN